MGVLLRRAIRATSQSPGWAVLALVLDAVIAVTAILIGQRLNLADLLAAGAPLCWPSSVSWRSASPT